MLDHIERHLHLFTHAMRADIRKAMHDVCVIVADKGVPLTKHPDLAYLRDRQTTDGRPYASLRGIGATIEHPVIGIGQETLFCGGPYSKQSLLLHELAHAVMDVAIASVDPALYMRIEQCYNNTVSYTKKNVYRLQNAREYWAESVEAYFQSTQRTDTNGGIDTRLDLQTQDPCLYTILQQVFGQDVQFFCDIASCSICDLKV